MRNHINIFAMMVGASGDTSREMTMPKWATERGEWDHIAQIEGPHKPRGVRVWVRRCEVCRFLIGRRYWQNELYLEPRLDGVEVGWRSVCGACAAEMGLGQGYCLVAEGDYDLGVEPVVAAFGAARDLKVNAIKHDFIERWGAFYRDRVRAYRTLRALWRDGYERDRRTVFEATLAEWRRYYFWHTRDNLLDWYLRADVTGQGCPDYAAHSRPSHCVDTYHRRLVPWDTRSLFHTFRSVYEPNRWTVSDHLSHREEVA